MTVDPHISNDVETSSTDKPGPALRRPEQRLTREQFEAAMRVMDARSPSRPLAGPPGTAPPALS